MSCYEWEAGNITLPTKEWAKFRKNLLTSWNAHLATVLETAKKAHTAAKAAGKGKRGDNRKKAMEAAVARICGGSIGSYGFEGGRGGNDRHNVVRDRYETVHGLIWKSQGWNKPSKFQSPQKKDLPFVAVSKDANINMAEASISFTNSTRTVNWDVPENNRACEAARDHWFASEFFTALGRITWTRGTGGEIVGNNEYNEDEHGRRGGRYVVGTYRMLTAAEKRAKAERARQQSRSYGYGGGYGRRY